MTNREFNEFHDIIHYIFNLEKAMLLCNLTKHNIQEILSPSKYFTKSFFCFI